MKLPYLRSPFLALAILFMAPEIGIAGQQKIKVGAEKIILPIPNSYCIMDNSKITDGRIISNLENASDIHDLLSVMAPCSELERWRNSEQETLDNMLSVQNLTTAKFLNSNEKEISFYNNYCNENAALNNSDKENIISNAAEELKSVAEITVNNSTILGIIERDDNRCYVGILQRLITPSGKVKAISTIYAPQIIKGKVVLNYLVAPFKSKHSMDEQILWLKTYILQQREVN